MPRLSVPLTDQQHTAIKVKAAQVGLAQAEVARRLLLAWLAGELDLPAEQRGTFEYQAEGFSVEHWNS
ncbi:MAG: hypothetical protein GTO22_23830 [Gemmatimonadales bacterium]|nr:hypothetical protein [Gemmatimonadales bacterium]